MPGAGAAPRTVPSVQGLVRWQCVEVEYSLGERDHFVYPLIVGAPRELEPQPGVVRASLDLRYEVVVKRHAQALRDLDAQPSLALIPAPLLLSIVQFTESCVTI